MADRREQKWETAARNIFWVPWVIVGLPYGYRQVTETGAWVTGRQLDRTELVVRNGPGYSGLVRNDAEWSGPAAV